MNLEDAIDDSPRKIRAFLALKTPRSWDEKLGELQKSLKTKFGSGAFRWVKPEQIHITLRFFGWLTTLQVAEAGRLLPGICSAHAPFTLKCETLGTFPNVRRPRVFWAGLRGDLEQATAFQKEVSEATASFGEAPEDRPFKPHLTLARVKDPERGSLSDLENAIARGFQIDEAWEVKELIFMQSHLSPQGSTYELLAKFPLGT